MVKKTIHVHFIDQFCRNCQYKEYFLYISASGNPDFNIWMNKCKWGHKWKYLANKCKHYKPTQSFIDLLKKIKSGDLIIQNQIYTSDLIVLDINGSIKELHRLRLQL